MHQLILITILAVCFATFSVDTLGLPRPIKFVPEILSLVAVLFVVAMGVQRRFSLVRAEYWLVFGAMLIVMLVGAIANAVQPGPLVTGFRYYMRAIPFFFLPMVCAFRPHQIRQQLLLLL